MYKMCGPTCIANGYFGNIYDSSVYNYIHYIKTTIHIAFLKRLTEFRDAVFFHFDMF